MTPRKIRIDDIRKIKFISHPQISPSGDKAAFVLTKVDYDKNGYKKQIWMWKKETDNTHQFTSCLGTNDTPLWSPNGKHLLFMSTERIPDKKGRSLCMIPADGGEAKPLAHITMNVSKPVWSPDSKRILFLSQTWPKGKPKSKVKVINRIQRLVDGVGLIDTRQRTHIFTVGINGGKPKQLTDGDFNVRAAKWSPDSQRIALIANTVEDSDIENWFKNDIYFIPAKGGELDPLTQKKYSISDISWSPNGEEIAFVGNDLHESLRTNEDIWVMSVEGGTPINLTASLDRSIGRSVGTDVRFPTPNPGAVWSKDSEAIYFLTASIPTNNVYRVKRETAEVEQLTEGRNIAAVSFSADCSVWGYTAGDATHLEELWIRDDEGDRRITGLNDDLLSDLKLSAPEHYIFKNEVGQDIDAWVVKPTDFKPGVKYPLVLKIHGGPTGVYGDAMFHEMQVLAAEDYVLIYTNPRGSGGYGEWYTACQQGHYGEVDLDDLDAFVDDALKRFDFVDLMRQGVIGGSYGGSIVNLWVTRTDRFKAAIACRSLSNSISAHGSCLSGWRHGVSGRVGFPWEDAEHLMTISPVIHASKIKTPLLMIHSELDCTNRVTEPEQLLVALRELGVDVELVVFPDQGHPLPRTGKPQWREERIEHILRWLNKYIK